MPGDYLFPKRALRGTGDLLDPDEFNQNALPAAERLNGQLNQHNVRAPLSATAAPIDAGAFASASFLSKFVPSGIAHSAPPFGGPATGDWEDRVDLYTTLSWQRVSNPGATGSADSVLQVTTGRSMLSLRAALWYSYHPDADASATAPAGGFGTSTATLEDPAKKTVAGAALYFPGVSCVRVVNQPLADWSEVLLPDNDP